jgi:transposase
LNHYTAAELHKLSVSTTDARKRIRLLALSHFLDGKNRAEISRMLKVSRRSVNDWVANYLKDGLSGLEAKKSPGRASYLDHAQKAKLSHYITQCSQSEKGGRLIAKDIQQYILKEFGKKYHLCAIYKLLETLNFSWITSRSRHPKQSQEIQDAFKKT